MHLPLSLLAASSDRRLLRHLSRLLGAFGYRISQAAGVDVAMHKIAADAPQVVFVDDRFPAEDVGRLCRKASGENAYVIVLVNEPKRPFLIEALRAGAGDFLTRPIIHAELLSRLRFAARRLEQDRRRRQRAAVEPVTGMMTRRAFMLRLSGKVAHEFTEGPKSCLVLDVHFFSDINTRYGRLAADTVLRQLAERINSQADEAVSLTASLGVDHFAVLIEGLPAGDAVGWAERFRRSLTAEPFRIGEDTLSITLSVGIAHTSESPPALAYVLERAEQAVAGAKSSGRDGNSQWKDFEEESQAWAQEVTSRGLFSRSVARDVMSPCPIILRSEDFLIEAEEIARRSLAPAIPVVDSQRRLAGLFEFDPDPDLAGSRPTFVGDAMETGVPQESEFAAFDAIIEFFAENDANHLVIVDHGRPVGLISRDSLASLTRQLTADTFASDHQDDGGSDYLLVADACADDA